MAKSVSSGNKRKKRPPKATKTSKNLQLGAEVRQKVLSHRKAQSEYYARNPEARARRRHQAAERRAAAKLKKRRWDPPKKQCTPVSYIARSVGSAHDSGKAAFERAVSDVSERDQIVFMDPQAQSDSDMVDEYIRREPSPASDLDAVVGTAASPTSEEFLASHALALLAEGVASHVLQSTEADVNTGQGIQSGYDEVQVNENAIDDWRAGSVDSILEKVNQLSSDECDAADSYIKEQALQITRNSRPLSRVQVTGLQVSEMNSGELTPATPEDAIKWRHRAKLVIEEWPRSEWTKKELTMDCWRQTVCDAVEQSRRKAARKEARQAAEDAKLGSWFQRTMRDCRLVARLEYDEINAAGGVFKGDEY